MIPDISKMSVLERIQVMEALWDTLTREPGELASPEWHAEIVATRKQKIRDGNATFVSLDELKFKHQK